MISQELQQYLLREFPQENACCEWKEMKNLKNSFAGDEKTMSFLMYPPLPIWKEDILL